MLLVTDADILQRLAFDNPWWGSDAPVSPFAAMPHRDYFEPFYQLVENRGVRRAVILLGPRRVGKTVMLYQMIELLRASGVLGSHLLYLSLETPILTGLPLEKLLDLFTRRFGHAADARLTVVFDEVQYLRDWEVHLKTLVDRHLHVRFVASGSSAAALRLKSLESGAGRFTDFLLPPLSFAEFLRFVGREDDLIRRKQKDPGGGITYSSPDLPALNEEFIRYLNYGGYPEAVFNVDIQQDAGRFIKSDIIDKVLLRDLPQLYGIQDIQELNRLFTTLAYNTANELSLEQLSQTSGVAKTTLARYLEYLEAAYLIRRVHRVDQNARHFQRARTFKVYLANPSMRAALFGSLANDDVTMGALAETALFAQWFHSPESSAQLFYGRWPKGEIDMIYLDPKTQAPRWCVEVKWSDAAAKDSRLLQNLVDFHQRFANSLQDLTITTKTIFDVVEKGGARIRLIPTSLRVYTVARNVVRQRTRSLEDVFAESEL